MKVRGSITIYLSMILISVMLLVNVIGESARISAVQAQIKSYTYKKVMQIKIIHIKIIHTKNIHIKIIHNERKKLQIKDYSKIILHINSLAYNLIL